MKVAHLCGAALDWAVARAMGFKINLEASRAVPFKVIDPDYFHNFGENYFFPSSQWNDGGPIIEKEGISLVRRRLRPEAERWNSVDETFNHGHYGPTPLTAAMRCFVASKLGNDIEIPKELQ